MLGSNYTDSRDENVTLNYNELHIVTNPYNNPNFDINGKELSAWPRIYDITSNPVQASGGAGADVIAVWTGGTVNQDTFSDTTQNPIKTLAPYVLIANSPTNTAYNFPSGGYWSVGLTVSASAAVTAGNTMNIRIDKSVNSGGAWTPIADAGFTQSGNANPPAVTVLNTSKQEYITLANANATWFRAVAGANYAANFAFSFKFIKLQ